MYQSLCKGFLLLPCVSQSILGQGVSRQHIRVIWDWGNGSASVPDSPTLLRNRSYRGPQGRHLPPVEPGMCTNTVQYETRWMIDIQGGHVEAEQPGTLRTEEK